MPLFPRYRVTHLEGWSADGWRRPTRCAVTAAPRFQPSHLQSERRAPLREHARKHDAGRRALRQALALRPRPWRCSLDSAPYISYGELGRTPHTTGVGEEDALAEHGTCDSYSEFASCCTGAGRPLQGVSLRSLGFRLSTTRGARLRVVRQWSEQRAARALCRRLCHRLTIQSDESVLRGVVGVLCACASRQHCRRRQPRRQPSRWVTGPCWTRPRTPPCWGCPPGCWCRC